MCEKELISVLSKNDSKVIEDYLLTIKNKENSKDFFIKSIKKFNLKFTNQFLINLAKSGCEANLKTIEILSQSPDTQYLNYCRFPLAFGYCKAFLRSL